jgi:hypothetical protein
VAFDTDRRPQPNSRAGGNFTDMQLDPPGGGFRSQFPGSTFGPVPGRTGTSPVGAMYGQIGADERVSGGSLQDIMGRVASIRGNRDLGGDQASDKIWADRISTGQATFGDVRQRLDRKSGEFGQTFQSANGINPYPTTLPSLSAEDFADLSQRRRAADSSLERALASHARMRGQVEADTTQARELLAEKFAGLRDQSMAGWGDRGAARQPRVAGQGLRVIRDRQAAKGGQLEQKRASRLSALQEMVSQARAAHTQELGDLEAERTRRKSDLSRMVQALGVS